MNIEIKRSPNTNIDAYDLVINGKVHVYAETMPVCDAIKFSLLNGPGTPYSEADEMADFLRDYV